MGYDQNNDYYSNGDQSWRDQTNVYQTQREQPTPMGRRSPRRKSGWLKGILAVLLVVAISFGAFYLMRNVGVRLERTEDGVTLSMTNRSKQAEPEQAEQPIPSPSASAQTETAAPQQTTQQPTQGAYVGSGTKLNIVSSQESSDTTFSDEEDALSLQDIYSTVIDSVVSISSMTSSGTSSGTGIIMSPDGYVITNHHVITGALVISVLTNDNQEYEAALVGSDEMSDLAVLKIDAENLTPIELGNSDALSVGDPVVAIGTPYSISLAGTLTQGVISGVEREVTVSSGTGSGTKTMRLLQTDTTINPGNSGGPLLNMQGQVVGINTLKLMDEYEGIGFAIPMTNAVEIINMLIQDGEVVSRPDNDYVTVSAYLNITVSEINDQTIALYRLPEDVPEGVLVVNIGSRTAAIYRAGVEVYDIITEFNGQAITNNTSLKEALAACKAGDEATIKVYRISRDGSSGSELTFTFRLDAAQ